MDSILNETARLLSRQSTDHLVDKDKEALIKLVKDKEALVKDKEELVDVYKKVNEALEDKLKTFNDRPWLMYTHIAIMVVLTVIAIVFYSGGIDFALTGMLLLIVYTVASGIALKYWGLV